MRHYDDFRQVRLGSSDIASLTLRAPRSSSILDFGIDASYRAYLVDEECVFIPLKYEKVFECKGWLKIYDDEGLSQIIEANRIEVFRCGDCGCIIKAL